MNPGGTRVVIVEDEAIVAMDLQRRVEQLGHRVVGTAASGESAIHRAEECRPDLILMDVHLQGEMDGVTAAEHIRRICEAPVVFLTAFSDATTVQRATATEPFGYVLKPVDDRELEIAIAVALNRRRADAERQVLIDRLSLATSVARMGIWDWNVLSNTLTWDATMFDIYGVQPVVPMPYEQWAAAVHPEDLPAVEAALRRAVNEKGQASVEFRILLAGGVVRNISAVEKAVLDDHASVNRVIGVNMDITERKVAEEALRDSEARQAHSAQHDFLTGLPNRMLMHDRAGQAIALAARHMKRVAVLFLDLDGFKHINDSLGHSIGDRLLQSIAARLVACTRGSDTVSRQGGDEFIVLMSEMDQADDAALMARGILHAVADACVIDEHVLHVTTSIGLSVYPDDGLNAETLIRNADTAMYRAKRSGRQTYQFFSGRTRPTA